MVAGGAVLLALMLGPVGPAVQTWTGSVPTGSCVGSRVVATTANPSSTYCCVSGTWTDCTAVGGGGGAPTNAQYWTGAADAMLSAEKNLGALATGLVLNTAGVPSAYTGATCTAPNVMRVLNASGSVTCYQIPLDGLTNPTGDKTFTMVDNHLKFSWVAPVTGGGFDSAIEFEATGAFTGHFFEVHQTGGNPGPGTHLLHLQAEDADVLPVHIKPANTSVRGLWVEGTATFDGAVTANLTGNASTATALSTAGAANQFWKNGNVWGQPAFSDLSGTATLAQMPTGTGVLKSAGAAPTYTTVDLSTDTAATALPVAKGGLGKTTLTSAGAIPVGTAGTTTYADLSGGAVGTILYNSAANTPAWLTNGTTTGLVLISSGGAAPSWGRPGYRVTGSNWTNGTTTVTDITGLSWAVASGVPQAFRCQMAVLNSNAGSAIRYAVNGPTMTTVAFKTKVHKASVTTEVVENFTAVSAALQTAGVTTGVATTAHIDTIEGVIIPSANGTMQIRGAGSAAQTSTVYQGSSCFVF